MAEILHSTEELIASFRSGKGLSETSTDFGGIQSTSNFQEYLSCAWDEKIEAWKLRAQHAQRLENASFKALNVQRRGVEDVLSGIFGKHPSMYSNATEICAHKLEEILELSDIQLIDKMTENRDDISRAITKKSYFMDRQLDLICHYFESNPIKVIESIRELGVVPSSFKSQVAKEYFAQVVGLAFGRYSVQGAKKTRNNLDWPLEALSISQDHIDNEAPPHSIKVQILDSSPHGDRSIFGRIEKAFERLAGVRADEFEQYLVGVAGWSSISAYVTKPSGFFDAHLTIFSRSRRKAPIYWPISTSSGSYTLWIYYPNLTDQTLFTAVNDFIEPKLKQVGQDVGALRAKGSVRSSDDEKSFEKLQLLEAELTELRELLLEIAPDYRPNYDDGVQISAAPLWRLFRHKPWQKLLKDTWAKLEKGDFDWAHLARAYWPDRVREKCKTDKSLAIAHDLEGLYEELEVVPGTKRGRRRAGGAT